jgi:hypothetical protein
MVLPSMVTAPSRARRAPWKLAPVVAVIEVKARTCPIKFELVPNVADEPTCQKTLQAWAPFTRATLLLLAVVKVEPALKMNTASGLFSASNVKVPVSPIELAEL